MTLSQSALNELLEAIRAGDGTDTLREAMRLVLQELIEAEATQVIGAARYERSEERTTHRNGSRSRLLSTKAGDVELRQGAKNVKSGDISSVKSLGVFAPWRFRHLGL